MVDTIETFVARLQQDGVQAGQAQAREIIDQARSQAQEILEDAKSQARQIIDDAESQAAGIIARSRTELQLAARDTIAQLRQTLSDELNAIIAAGAKTTLSDLDFLGRALHEIVTLYAKANMERKLHIDINVPGDIRDDLRDWALSELGKDAVAKLRPSLDLRGKLRQVGFEYSIEGDGTVEVTLDSVVQTLSKLVTPALREILQKATTEK